jgi:serine/threonine-protein kinase
MLQRLQLSHPNLVTIYDFGRTAAGDYLAMELVRGATLRRFLGMVGPLPAEAAVAILSQALQGLQAAHELRDDDGQPLGLVHRDLTPRNLMVGFDGLVKVLDFGVAKSQDQRAFTAAGEVRGKLRYLSPEQLAQKVAVDRPRRPVHCGCSPPRALTGHAPFERKGAGETIDAILDDAPESEPRIPKALWRVVEQALQKDRQAPADCAGAGPGPGPDRGAAAARGRDARGPGDPRVPRGRPRYALVGHGGAPQPPAGLRPGPNEEHPRPERSARGRGASGSRWVGYSPACLRKNVGMSQRSSSTLGVPAATVIA